VSIDQNVADRRILEQRLDRPEADHLGEHIAGEFVELLLI
jgi:hypothetical protein